MADNLSHKARRATNSQIRGSSIVCRLARAAATCAFVLASVAQGQVSGGLINDFQDGSNQGWIGDDQSITPMTNGGPDGDGDGHLQVVSSGGAGPGSRWVVRNLTPAWRGDYIAAEIVALRLDVNNLGTENSAVLRLAITRNGGRVGDWWSTKSTLGITLPPASGWTTVMVPISEETMTLVSGGGEYSEVLSNVTEIRILVNPVAEFKGAIDTHRIALDNLRLLGNRKFADDFESPTLSQ